MSDIRFVFAGENTELQHDSVAMLARCFDEWRMFQTACGNIFPFREISFVALAENDKIAGHVGIMPFEVWDGKGKIIHMAGIASVGTDPDYRGRGICPKILEILEDRAREKGCCRVWLEASEIGKYVYQKRGFEENEMVLMIEL